MLVAHDLSFTYRHGPPLIDDFTAEFAVGGVTAITGPSGRGKSTLLYLLGLILHPTSGEVLVRGEVVSGLSDSRRAGLRAHEFGFVFQDSALDTTRTIADNVIETALYRGMPRATARARALELLERFGVGLRVDARPGQISGGQAQRVALCRALLGEPPILLADEPTGNLDSVSADVVVSAFRDHARRGNTVVVVTHDPSVVERCDSVIAL